MSKFEEKKSICKTGWMFDFEIGKFAFRDKEAFSGVRRKFG